MSHRSEGIIRLAAGIGGLEVLGEWRINKKCLKLLKIVFIMLGMGCRIEDSLRIIQVEGCQSEYMRGENLSKEWIFLRLNRLMPQSNLKITWH